MIQKMKDLARQNDLCVLATASGGKPHCSLMAYATDEECTEIYMATYRDTQKFKNLMENPYVSLLIDTREEHRDSRRSGAKAMTVSGTFERLVEDQEKTRARSLLLRRHPHLEKFCEHPDAELLCIKIHSFLLLDGLTDSHYAEMPG